MAAATFKAAARHDAKDIGAAIAYYSFFSVFPFLVGLMAVAGFFLDSADVQERVFLVVEEAVPGSGELIEENMETIVGARGTLGLVGLIGLLWSASAGLGAVARSVDRAWGSQSTRPLPVQWLRYFLLTVSTIVLLTLSLGVTAFVEMAPLLNAGILDRVGVLGAAVDRLTGQLTSLLSVFVMFALIYKVMPIERVSWRRSLPGAALSAVLFELAKGGLVIYLERIADFSIYGSMGSIIALLLWLYVSARILILGAEFNVVLDETGRGNAEPSDSSRRSS